MSHVFRIETQLMIPTQSSARLLREAREYLGVELEDLVSLKVFRISTASEPNTEQIEEVFVDAIMEQVHWSDGLGTLEKPPVWTVEVQFRPGVTDNVARSAEEALGLVGINGATVATGQLWLVYGDVSRESVERVALELLANDLIQRIDIRDWTETLEWSRFDNVRLPSVELGVLDALYQTHDHRQSVDDWMIWSKDNCWALSTEEVSHLRNHYASEAMKMQRTQMGLPAEPTDVEVEVIAQSWSEHCKHKIFAAHIDYVEGDVESEHTQVGSKKVNSLFKSYIRKATLDVEKSRSLPWLRSIFHDNAGVVAFDDAVDVSIKVETHNSPSALDPYGGAITGILGVNRDILGVGLGSKPIGNMDVFCFADPSWPLEGDEAVMPVGLKAPRRLLEGVHKGVEDGGNMSGIPTVNGAIFFDQDYAGKPLVFVGTVGVMPKQLGDGREGVHKAISPGDRIVMVGGAIGADGIHGATFSSLALDENAPATAVQIGDAITQKRAMDFLLEARDLGLFTCVTDNGAGGLSSSVGEMATLSNGATLDLSLAPTKYPNLKPWELMISESQERMTFAVAPTDIDAFLDLASRRGVVATDIGSFTDSGLLEVLYNGTYVGCLDLDFLHESLPQMQLKARWEGSIDRASWIDKDLRKDPTSLSWSEKLKGLLATPNVVSKEPWVRQYDHEVQGATVVKPFGGDSQQGPNDSGVLWLHPHGGAKDNAVSVGCGLAPRLSLYDPYVMAQMSVDEAIRNIVATGADIDQACALDNFCWPNPILSDQVPDGDLKLGQLVRCCEGLYDICTTYGLPLVSGKDSMKNDFRGRNGRGEALTISILPTLLVTAMGRSNVSRIQTSDFKRAGDVILRVGMPHTSFTGSEFAEHFSVSDAPVQIDLDANLTLYRLIRDVLQEDLLQSIHDISDGGTLCAIAESCFGNDLSAALTLPDEDEALFAEGAGGFIVSVSPDKLNQLSAKLDAVAITWQQAGMVTDSGSLTLNGEGVPIAELKNAWTREL